MSPYLMTADGTLAERLKEISYNFKANYNFGDVLFFLAAVLVVVLFIVALSRYYPLYRRAKQRRELFDNLCRLHGLTAAERTLLDAIVEQDVPANPFTVFVKKSILEARIASARGDVKDRLETLADRLFGASST